MACIDEAWPGDVEMLRGGDEDARRSCVVWTEATKLDGAELA